MLLRSLSVALALVTLPMEAVAQSPPAASPAPGATTPSAATRRSERPRRARRAPAAPDAPDLLSAATQVLQGAVQPGSEDPARPRSAPAEGASAETLRRAGLDPSRLPGVLGPLLRADPARAEGLSASQLRQLGRLARARASRRQLESVIRAFQGRTAQGGSSRQAEGPTLTATQLDRVARRVAAGASADSVGRLVGSLLRAR